jgi:anti-anti-sigma factor
MNITKRVENDIAVFSVEGRIDFLSVLEIDDALQTAISTGQHNMVLDMTKVQYINSAGLRTLAKALTMSKKSCGDLKLAALDPMVMLLFEMVGFDRLFTIYDTLQAALASFGCRELRVEQ